MFHVSTNYSYHFIRNKCDLKFPFILFFHSHPLVLFLLKERDHHEDNNDGNFLFPVFRKEAMIMLKIGGNRFTVFLF